MIYFDLIDFFGLFSFISVKILPVTRAWLTLEYWSLFCCRTITFCQCLKCLFPFNTNQRSSQFCYVCLKVHVNICLNVSPKVNLRVMLEDELSVRNVTMTAPGVNQLVFKTEKQTSLCAILLKLLLLRCNCIVSLQKPLAPRIVILTNYKIKL